MEPIRVFKRREEGSTWEYTVLLGHDSRDVGFLVKIDRQYWEYLTDGRESPEQLVRKCFRFLLKKQSKYSILRSFDLREIDELFPEFKTEIKKTALSAP
ncbi:MAG: hypothetical protein A3J30_03420 [Candidatus Wildermuthbacteria bacterium RIFCSPLOWO2_02_FULL_47_9c]|uniref:Uncharacterized protein n=2 Tax=Parcubacteria group TaxID=1794811 RepID=A0A837ILC6_9BACT|nr:MAG: hypothetical protein UY25_C0002G0055 [Candidatus Yanofskybacteria bacterium GW2011_GWC1_48_11]KKW04697.1 MAG: hypothetical protein UY38_C0001G0264 [Parcubacteria group bacterium GW2011_GWB1_49_12]KKW09003.1 MAG: hypothetical protein UY45_C0002G0055 [Parcubacteria group bacterium GW2011_GWA1_49_26]KKW14227.1 MAG: hypothetical protein UY53_C0002G0016 [Parcubacteria group bacterium GW2011_GWA2_50_10]OHA61056.1 MAG: hypothetical protein A2109_02275 [Candidatus Wildermuthbacteria bacterium G